MKFIVFAVLFFAFTVIVNGQDNMYLDSSFQEINRQSLSGLNEKKWSFSTYKGISAGFTGWRGGYATTYSVPVGIQVNRRLNNNLYAFGAVTVAPTLVNFGHSFMNTNFSKSGLNNSMYSKNNFGLYQRAEIGLSYTNDERTFRISGSIGIERDNNNFLFPHSSQYGLYNNPSRYIPR